MIINDKYRFVFVHIPKTAGTSIHNALGEIEGRNRRPTKGLRTKHETLPEFMARLELQPSSIMPSRSGNVPVSDYLFFCFVRNPWSRFCSMHRFLRGKENLAERVPADVNAFARRLGDLDPWILKLRSCRLQVDFLSPQVRFVGRYENLTDDFADVMGKLGLTISLPHMNSSDSYKEDYRHLLTEQSAEIVGSHYQADVRQFGYSF